MVVVVLSVVLVSVVLVFVDVLSDTFAGLC